jgi:serine phosphatase RsbU (regulator of sigma subunit)
MKIIYFILYLSLVIILIPSALAQSDYQKINEIQQQIGSETNDSILASLFDDLAMEYYFINLDSSDFYTSMALDFLKESGSDYERARIYNTKGVAKYYRGDFDSAYYWWNKKLNIILKLQDDTRYTDIEKEIGDSYNNLGIAYRNKGEFDSAMVHYYKAIEYYDKIDSYRDVCDTYYNIGVIYASRAEFNKAIECNEIALKNHKKHNDASGIADIYNNLSVIYREKGDYKTSMKYTVKSLRINDSLQDEYGIAEASLNMGTLLYHQHEFERSQEYNFKALELFEKLNFGNGLAECYNNIAMNLFYLEEYNNAEEYFIKALEKNYELGDAQGVSDAYTNLAIIKYNTDDYSSAIDYYYKAYDIDEYLKDQGGIAYILMNLGELHTKTDSLELARQEIMQSIEIAHNLGSLAILTRAYKKMTELESAANNYKEALEYYTLYFNATDSLYSENQIKILQELEITYQSEKKQILIEKQQDSIAKVKALNELASLREKELIADNIIKEKEKTDAENNAIISKQERDKEAAENQKLWVIVLSLIIGFILIAVLAYIVYKSYLQKKKMNMLLEKKNTEIEDLYMQTASQKEEIVDSINYAKRIQEALLPEHNFNNKLLVDYFILFKPKDVVSGDFYWKTEVNDWMIIAAADCTGHGVPGAFMSMLGISFLNEIIRKKEVTNAAEVLNQLRTSVIESLGQQDSFNIDPLSITENSQVRDGMDISLAAINLKTKTLQWAGANNPIYMIPDGSTELKEIKGNKMPIGIYVNMTDFTNHEFSISSGDQIYLLSDGFPDQFGGPRGKKFKYKPFKELLFSLRNMPMKEQKTTLENTLESWMKGTNQDGEKYDHPQVDDITIIGLRF